MTAPWLSIIIPAYNVADYLPGCLGSILKSQCRNYEILLVDDGSTDGATPALCDRLAAQHPNVRAIHQENMGLGGARNTGLEQSAGTYVFFVDGDDTIAPDTLPLLHQAVTQTQADIVSFGLEQIWPTGGHTAVDVQSPNPGRPFSAREFPAILLALPSACIRIWRRSLFLDSGIRFPSRVWYEDLRTTPKLFALSSSIYVLNRPLYRYLQRPDSIMHQADPARNLEILAAMDDLIQWFASQGLTECFQQELTMLCLYHTYLTASVRVAQIDPKSPILKQLYAYLPSQYPDYRSCPYASALSPLQKLALRLVRLRQYRMLSLLFRLKNHIH